MIKDICIADFPNRKTTVDMRCLVCDTFVPAGSWVLPLPDGNCACCSTCVERLAGEDSVADGVRDMHESCKHDYENRMKIAAGMEDDAAEKRTVAISTLRRAVEAHPDQNAVSAAGKYITLMEEAAALDDEAEVTMAIAEEANDQHAEAYTLLYEIANESSSHEHFEPLIIASTAAGDATANLFD